MDESPAELFETELAVFHEHLEGWLPEHLGRYALISGSEVIGQPFDTEIDAVTVGYQECGIDRLFLVRPILPHQPVHNVGNRYK